MKDLFKFKPYKKTESFYANLSALFLSMSIIFGPISIITGIVLFKCYSIYLNEVDISMYYGTTLVLLIISIHLFVVTYKKYNKLEKYNIKNIIKPKNIRESYQDIYVLGTLVVLLIFVTTIYFINNNYKEKAHKLNELKYSVSKELNKVSFADKYKYIIINDDSFTGYISVDKDMNLIIQGSRFLLEVPTEEDTESIINKFDNNIKVLFKYMNDYEYDEYYNEVNKDIREAINNYKNGSLNESYNYKRTFNNINRFLNISLQEEDIVISLSYK